jgi:signal transduction histidine kinase
MPAFAVIIILILMTLVFYLILSRREKEKIEFFHVMAHRFRSPISIIRWYTELLSDKSVGNLNDKQKEYFTEIVNASEKLNETIDSLVILLQMQSKNLNLKIEKVNLKDVFSQIINKLKFKIERHKLHLQESYPNDREPVLQTDPRLLGIVFQNLLENSIRYTSENGNINIKINFLKNKMLIEIKDNGYGIPKERKSRILADSVNSKDMSFSLYLVKLILKEMHGQIDFKSEENKGTTFSLFLPT